MVEIALVTQAIGAVSAGLTLIDQIADQIREYVHGRRPPPGDHSLVIQAEGDRMVSRQQGREFQVITASEMAAKLPQQEFQHVQVLEKAMENHYKVWAGAYPDLALMEGVQKAKTRAQLDQVIQDMKGSLVGILDFLEACGFILDDHYGGVRDAVEDA
jgi:hypothetical protein